MSARFDYVFRRPDGALADFVESFWMLHNLSDSAKEVVILPDGRIDLSFSQSAAEPFRMTLLGLTTHPELTTIPPNARILAISFNLLATEYVLHETVADVVGTGKRVVTEFGGIGPADLQDFDLFCQKASRQLQSCLPDAVDARKQKLFSLLYASSGSITVNELAKQVAWSRRQINRYFTQQYGISLKTYAGILRFRASFGHIRRGDLLPEQDFADQSHFIREVRKLAGVSPKELYRNSDDRFIQFTLLG